MECIKDRFLNNLNREILVLRDENHMLRMKLEETERRFHVDRSLERSLDHENHLLKHDLSKVEMLSRSMIIEKDHAILDSELELVRLQKKLKQMEIDYENVEQEKYGLSDQLNELQQSSTLLEIKFEDSKDIVSRIQEDKLRLTHRIEKLTANERALVLELERLKRRENGGKPRESVNQVEQYMRGIEIDRDYWKNEAELLRELQRKVTRSPTRAESPAIKQTMTKQAPKKTHSKDKQRIKELEKEKDELKIQLESLCQDKPASLQRNRSPSPIVRARSPTKDQHKADEDIVQIKRERDDLKNLLSKLEKKVAEIQSNVKLLTKEKDKYCQLYEDSQKQILNMNQKLLTSQEDGGRALSQTKKLLNQVEIEKNDLQTELIRAQKERDSILERQKSEKDGSNQFRQQIQKLELNLESAERQASLVSSQLAKSEERGLILEQRIASMTEKLRLQRDNYSHFRCNACHIDDDNNQLKCTLAEAMQQLKQLENDLVATEDELRSTHANLSMTEKQLGKVTEALTSRESENRQIRMKTDQANDQNDELQRKLSIQTRDNEKLSENVADLLRSNKNLKKDLKETIEEREKLRSQIQIYIAEVKGAENLLAERERDQTELLENYQLISRDIESVTQKCEMGQRELLMCKEEIRQRENDLERLQQRYDAVEKENIECKFRNRELESRLDHLSLIINQNRDQANIIQHERDALISDLSALRDLCGRLEKAKDDLEKELDSRNLDLEQLKADMDDLEHENDTLREEILEDKQNIRSVENALNICKGQEQNCVSEIQEKTSELNMIRGNLQAAEETVEQLQCEMQRLKSRNADLERETDHLQETLATEKFEKERALSEIRIQSLTPKYTPSCYLSNGSHRSCSPCKACPLNHN